MTTVRRSASPLRSRIAVRLAAGLAAAALLVLPGGATAAPSGLAAAESAEAGEHAGHAAHADQDAHAAHADHGELPGTAPLASESVYQLGDTWTRARGAGDHARVALSDLRGQPVVMLLFYGTCKSVCPILVRDLQRIDAALSPAERERVRFVLVTFDPDVDTPERLARYAAEHELPTERFWPLHGDPHQVRALAAVLGVRYRSLPGGQYSHTQRITLLDREGRVAAHFDGLERPVDGIVAQVREQVREQAGEAAPE